MMPSCIKPREVPRAKGRKVPREMGLPFSVTTFMWTHAATFLLLIPILAVALPMIRVVPIVYIWNVRRRLLYWYRQLRWLERSLDKRSPGLRTRRSSSGVRSH